MRVALAIVACAALSGCGAPPAAESNRSDAPAVVANEAAAPAAETRDDIPAAFLGRWDSDAAACGRPSEYRLRIEPRALRFHESIGEVRRVSVEGPRAVSVAADYQGEGESWSGVSRLTLSGDGGRLTIESGGTRLTRVRCPASEARWEASASGEGAGLSLVDRDAGRRITLFCPAGRRVLIVNVPGFAPVGSEERMSFGASGTVTTLVADPAGDRARGGVTGEAPVPEELAEILDSPAGMGVNYGAQNAGPFPPVPAAEGEALLRGCSG